MSSSPPRPPRPFPRWLMVLCSTIAVVHLSLMGLFALAASSGPWPVPPPFGGESLVEGPAFATSISGNFTLPYYLKPLRMTHNYHFNSNRPAPFAAYFEARLKDEAGNVTVLKFPDEKANGWVRHRQELLAQNLAQDQRLPPRGAQPVAEAGMLPKIDVWEPDGPFTLRLKSVTELELKPMQQYEQPSAWTKVVAQSYARYLLREHKAVSVELVRCSRPTVMPMMMFLPDAQIKDSFTEMKAHFGEYRRE